MEIFLALVAVVLSFFFSGIEIAFLSASRLRVELRLRQGHPSARLLSDFYQRTSQVIITVLIGNNLALVVFTLMFNGLTSPWLSGWISPEESYLLFTFVQSLMATLLILVVAEYIPKAIFRNNADTLVFPAAYILAGFVYLLSLPVWVVNGISKFLLRLFFRVTTEERIVTIDKRELDLYIQEVTQDEHAVPDLDREMLSNAMGLKDTRARECMIPRTELVAAPDSISIGELMEQFIETQLSKVLIYKDNLDDIAGYVHSHSMFLNPQDVKSLIQPVLVVPESMPANNLLKEFISQKRTLAVVVDEFGGTAGMVTIEDLVEELFGEIEDEHDEPEEQAVEADLKEEQLADGSYLFGARLEVAYLNKEYGLDLPEKEFYTTLGGLILYAAEDIPAPGEVIALGAYEAEIMQSSENRLICVALRPGRGDSDPED